MLAEQLASTRAMQSIFATRASVQTLLDVEAALTQAGAACGLISAPAAEKILAACALEALDLEILITDAQRAGTIVIPLVKWLKAQSGDAAAEVHLGGTSQDILDTALVLQLRAGILLLQQDLATMAQAAAALAQTHATTNLPARTLLQAALPTTFGLKAAYWLAAIDDSRTALSHAADEAIVLQCGGAAGTLDAVAGFAPEFTAAFASALNLRAPNMPWHTSRAPLLRLAAAITGAVGVAGKIATDIALMMQTEVAELAEPPAPGRGGASAMAHKRNPTLSITARAAAARMPGFLSSLATAQVHEHERAAGAWQSEAATWPALMLCASGALAAMAETLPGLVVNTDAMAHNLTNIARNPPGAAQHLLDASLKAHKKFQETSRNDR
jgi:3-carboxy-cis,cis-muconate cycloisomerase